MSKQEQHETPGSTTALQTSDKTAPPNGMSLSMHDGVEVWCDCCSCEVEPYWLEAYRAREPLSEKD